MIKKLEISGIHFEVSSDLQKYITKRIKKIERLVPKQARSSVHVEVKLKEEKSKDKKQCHSEIIMHLPGGNLAAEGTTVNMFAACDIVLAKMKTQLEKYRSIHSKHDRSRTNRKIRAIIGKIHSR